MIFTFSTVLTSLYDVSSSTASAGYLTVSETFPLEIRALAIAFSTGIGGAAGPLLFGKLLGGDDPTHVAIGRSLEEVAEPLSAT